MAFPTTGILDAFTRADESPLANGWAGPTEAAIGQLKLVSNQAFGVADVYSSSYWNTSFAADQEAYVDIATVASTGYMGVWGRFQNPGNASTATGYQVVGSGVSSKVQVWKLTAGHTYTQLGADISQAVATNDKIGIAVYGTTIEAWLKPAAGSWTLIGTRTDSAISGAGYTGMVADHISGVFDNFGGGAMTAGSGAGVYRMLMGVG